MLWRSVRLAGGRALPAHVAISCCCRCCCALLLLLLRCRCCRGGGSFPSQHQAPLAAAPAAEAAAAAAAGGGHVAVKALHQVTPGGLCTVIAVWRLAILIPSLYLRLRLWLLLLMPLYCARWVQLLLLQLLLLLLLMLLPLCCARRVQLLLLLLLQQQWRRLHWLHAAGWGLHSLLLGAAWLHHAAKHSA